MRADESDQNLDSTIFTIYLNNLLIRWREGLAMDHQFVDQLLKYEENHDVFVKRNLSTEEESSCTHYIDQLISHLPELQEEQLLSTEEEFATLKKQAVQNSLKEQSQANLIEEITDEDRERLRAQRKRNLRRYKLSQIFNYRANLFNQKITIENDAKYLMVAKNDQHMLVVTQTAFQVYPLNVQRTLAEIGCFEYDFHTFQDKRGRGRNLVLLDLDDQLQNDNLQENQNHSEIDQDPDNIIEKENKNHNKSQQEEIQEQEANLESERKSLKSSPRRNEGGSFQIGEILFGDIHDNQNYILIYQREKEVFSNLAREYLYVFDLKEKSQLQFQKWDLLSLLKQTVSKDEKITQLSFHEDYNDFQIINIKTDRLQDITVDLKNDFIFDVSEYSCAVDLSIFRKPHLYMSYFDLVKQFVYDNSQIGNIVVLPYRDTNIIGGYDFQNHYFFIYDIKKEKIVRKFKLFDDFDFKSSWNHSSHGVKDSSITPRVQIKLKKEDLKFFQISDEGSLIAFIQNQTLYVINVRLSEEIDLLLTPTQLINYLENQQDIGIQDKNSQANKANIHQIQGKKSANQWIQSLESKYLETQNKNITQHEREDLMKALQLEVQECLAFPKEIFQSQIALRAIRDFQNTCPRSIKEDFKGLRLMGFLENVSCYLQLYCFIASLWKL